MSVWNSIGEFFLFRLLVDKFKKCITYHDTHTEISRASIDRNIEFLNGTINEGIAPDDAFTDIDDNLTDDSISPENLDDLDIIMRNNNGDNRSCMHHGDYEDVIIIISAVVTTAIKIGILIAILNHLMISMMCRRL